MVASKAAFRSEQSAQKRRPMGRRFFIPAGIRDRRHNLHSFWKNHFASASSVRFMRSMRSKAKADIVAYRGTFILPKLSVYVEMAAIEYLRETGKADLDARWIAEYFQDAGVLDEHPRQNLIAFADLVQKALDKEIERIRHAAAFLPDNVIPLGNPRRKP